MRRIKAGRLKEVLPYFIVKKHICEYDYATFKGLPPHIFNEWKEEMNVFYLKDSGNPPYSLSLGRYPRRIMWDRFNRGLANHFYVHENMLGETYDCEKKYGILRESEEIIPYVYEGVIKRRDLMKEYSCIFTSSEMILSEFANARFAPANSVWYGTEPCGGVMSDRNYENKSRNISIIASNKSMCKLHKVRAQLAKYYMYSDKVDTYGRAVGRYIAKKADALEKYRYSIVIENSITPYYFTEKILDCFAAMTVPIYLGATRIEEFFNSKGIITIDEGLLDDFSKIDTIIECCCERDYEERIDAIRDNFKRVQEYLCFEDYIYEHYEELR